MQSWDIVYAVSSKDFNSLPQQPGILKKDKLDKWTVRWTETGCSAGLRALGSAVQSPAGGQSLVQGINMGILFNPFNEGLGQWHRVHPQHLRSLDKVGRSGWCTRCLCCYPKDTERLGRQEPYCTEYRCLVGMFRGNCTESLLRESGTALCQTQAIPAGSNQPTSEHKTR